MTKWGMVFDLNRCIGCNACVVACKTENSLPEDVFFTRTFVTEVGSFPNVRRHYIPTLCNHCEDAPCEKACPSDATHTRDDGIVMVDQEKCIGCNACAVACPYDNRTQLTKAILKRAISAKVTDRLLRRTGTSAGRPVRWPSAISAALALIAGCSPPALSAAPPKRGSLATGAIPIARPVN